MKGTHSFVRFYEDGNSLVELHEELTELYGEFGVARVMWRNVMPKNRWHQNKQTNYFFMITPVLTTKPGLNEQNVYIFTRTPYSRDFHPYILQPRLSPIHPTAQTFSHTPYSPDFGVFKFFFFFYNEMKQKLKLTTSSQSACVQVDSRWLTGITNKDSVDEVSASRAKVRRVRDGLGVTDRLSERSGTPEDTWRQMPNKSDTRCWTKPCIISLL